MDVNNDKFVNITSIDGSGSGGSGNTPSVDEQEDDTSIFDSEGASDETNIIKDKSDKSSNIDFAAFSDETTTIEDKTDKSSMNSITNKVSEYLSNNPEEADNLLDDLKNFINDGGLMGYINEHMDELGDDMKNLFLSGGILGYLANDNSKGIEILDDVKEFINNGGLIGYMNDHMGEFELMGDNVQLKDIILGGGLIGYLSSNQDKAAEILENASGEAKNFLKEASEKGGILGWLASPFLKLFDMFSNE